ncbi:MAG: hypothetical protein IJD01_01095 [Clostridia bacterium]|nr:hypothetical protein [Clostridia bacterium]
MKRLAMTAALCAACVLTLTACFKPSATVETGTSTTTPTETRVTVAVPKDQLSLELLMTVVDADTAWSELQPYVHTVTDDTHATFTVMNSSGQECTLTVAFDAAADKVTEAVLSYGATSADVLSDDNTVALRSVMIAMNEG